MNAFTSKYFTSEYSGATAEWKCWTPLKCSKYNIRRVCKTCKKESSKGNLLYLSVRTFRVGDNRYNKLKENKNNKNKQTKLTLKKK